MSLHPTLSSRQRRYVFGLSVCRVRFFRSSVRSFVRSFVGSSVRPSVRSFARTDLVTTISYKRLEQSLWNLQRIFTSPPLVMTSLVKDQRTRLQQARPSRWRRHARRLWGVQVPSSCSSYQISCSVLTVSCCVDFISRLHIVVLRIVLIVG